VISDGPKFDFGTHAQGTTTNHLLVVTNTGTAAATAMASTLAVPFAYVGGGYPGDSATCGAALLAGASCTIDVAFSAGTTTPATETLTIAYFDGTASASASRDLVGEVTSSAFLTVTDNPLGYYQQYGLQADAPTFNFGARGVGSMTTQTFSVTNTGAATATTISGGALASPFGYPGQSGYPGTGGSCAATLAPGDSCTVVVVFAPAGPTPATATLSINYDDGSGNVSATRAMAGSGTSEPVLVVQDFNVANLQAAAWDFGTIGVGGTAAHEFYVTNTGGATASSLAALAIGSEFGYVDGSYPGTGGTCAASLGAGSACTVEVVFQPTTPGLAAGSVTLTYKDAAANPFSAGRVVHGIGTNLGVLQIVDGSDHGPALVTDFGPLALNVSATHTFTVQNIGAGAVSAMSFAALATPFSFPGGFPGTGGNCDVGLGVGASCKVVVSFTPGSVGDFAATLSVGYDDGSATQSTSRSLAGEGIDGALLSISDWSSGGGAGNDPFDFGAWGTPTTHTFYLTNSGNKPATSLAVGSLAAPFSLPGGYPGSGGNCGPSLAVGASCTLVVGYSGASTAGAAVTVSYGDGDGDTLAVTRQVMGEAVANALLVIADCAGCGIDNSPADFGTTPTSTTRTLSLQNDGAMTATMIQDGGITGAFAYVGGHFPGAGGNCTTSLASGANCSLSVVFTPTGAGSYAGTMAVGYDDGTGASASATRGLQGAETNLALLTIHDWSATDSGDNGLFDYGVVGVPTDHTFTITNDGAQAATLIADGSGLGNQFSWQGSKYPGTSGTCGTSLPQGGQCTVVVTFTPSGNQQYGSSLILSYFDGANVDYASTSLQGTATTHALVQASDSYPPPPNPYSGNLSPYDYGTTGSAIDHVFSITNWGGGPATLLADGGTLGAGFAWTGNLPFGGGNCGTQLGAGQSCSVSVTFTPSGNGPSTSTLTISYSDGSTAQLATRSLTAASTTHAVVNIYDWSGPGMTAPTAGSPPFDYGVWGVATDHPFTLRNDGGGPATLLGTGAAMGTGFAWQGGTFPGTTGNCTGSLAVGATCTAVVTFTPSGSAALSGQVQIAYSDAGTSETAGRAVTGTPTSRAYLTVSEFPGPNSCPTCAPYSFGTVAVGSSAAQTFTVYNTGALTAINLDAAGGLGAAFGYQGTAGYPGTGGSCQTTLAPNSQCQLTVVFAPQAVGAASGTLSVSYDDTFMSPLVAGRALSGTGD
jgi:hypothetical protein